MPSKQKISSFLIIANSSSFQKQQKQQRNPDLQLRIKRQSNNVGWSKGLLSQIWYRASINPSSMVLQLRQHQKQIHPHVIRILLASFARSVDRHGDTVRWKEAKVK